jgi:glycosyltransferase involved in cell wall biosynthesis
MMGADFHLLLLGNGHDVYESMVHALGITENVTVEPFVAPWNIPQFIDRCDAVAFLEYDFPIKFHSPGVPYEVLSRGTCLIVSNDIVGRLGEPRTAELPDQNLIEVDPRRPDSIVAAIVSICSRVENAHEIGSRGRDLADLVGDSSQWNAFVEQKLQLSCAPADTNHYGWSSVVGWLSRSTKADPEGMLEKLWAKWREVDAQSFPNSMVEAYAFSKYLEERTLPEIGTSELKLDSIRLWQFMDCQDDYFSEFDNGPDATDDQLQPLVTSY